MKGQISRTETDRDIKTQTRPGVDTVKPKVWFNYHVLFNMGDLRLGLPALNLSTLNAGHSRTKTTNIMGLGISGTIRQTFMTSTQC